MPLRNAVIAAAGAAVTAFAAAPHASASPVSLKLSPAAVSVQSDVVKVGQRRHYGTRHFRGKHVYRGHRSVRHHHHRKRHYRPRSSFSVVIAPRRQYVYFPPYRKPQPVKPRIIRVGSAHVRWCDAKYRSYRVSDNTFQPYHGPRKQCVSPYR